MAVKITHKLPLGRGIKAYQFEVQDEPDRDREIYENGLKVERELSHDPSNRKEEPEAPKK